MERSELVEQILKRVSEKLAELDSDVYESDGKDTCDISFEKKDLIILSQKHDESCHRLLISSALNEKMRCLCALNEDFKVDICNAEAVVLFDLTVDTMTKIAMGTGDCPYTRLAVKALLSGKKLYIPRSQVQLYSYKDTAVRTYYKSLERSLDILIEAGLTICDDNEIEAYILGDKAAGSRVTENAVCNRAKPSKKTAVSKRAVTERDIMDAAKAGLNVLEVSCNSIVTDLARDFARARGIELVRVSR